MLGADAGRGERAGGRSVRAVLPAKKAARFFQIENKLDAIVNVSLAQQIPLVPLKK